MQINFRIPDDEKSIVQYLAEQAGLSIAEFAKQAFNQQIASDRVEIAFKLLELGKIGQKKAWKLSGLSGHEFLFQMTKRGIYEQISEEANQVGIDLMQNLNMSLFKKAENP